MNSSPSSFRQPFLASLCIFATLWNTSNKLLAADAVEVQRPFAAEGDLSVSVEEEGTSLDSGETAYIITFKNLSDHEVAYDGLSINFPDLKEQPHILTPEEAERYRRERAQEITNPNEGSSSTSSGTHFHPYVHHSSGMGSCKEACVIFVVFFVVIIIAVIAVGIANANRAEKEKLAREASLAKRLSPNPEGPIQLLRYQSTTRQIILRKDPRQAIKTMVIEVMDKNEKKRAFKANLWNQAT